jgi:predicted DNA-binding transcriptional regulator YafY
MPKILITNLGRSRKTIMSNSTILRQITMLKIIPKHPSFILTKTIEERLNAEGFTTTLRTIQRDLDKLSTLMGLITGDSPEGLKWSYVNNSNELLPALSPNEALILCIAQQQMNDQLPFDTIDALEPRFSKAEQTLASSPQFKNWRERVKVISFGLPLKANLIEEDIRKPVYDGVLQHKQLQLTYRKNNGDTQEYTLNAHGLIIREHTHYLVASKAETPNDFQLFKLSRISEVVLLVNNNMPCSNSIKHYLNSNASGYLLADRPIKMSLLATGPALAMFEEATLSSDQTIEIIKQTPRVVAQVNATIEFTHELTHFLLGFGKWIKVIEPKALIDAIIERHNNSIL